MPNTQKAKLRTDPRSRNARRYARALGAVLEKLEPRQLLSVDLTGSFLTAPVSALSGTKQNVTVSVVNNGTTQARGSMTISFYIAPDGDAFDANTDLLLGKLTKSISIAPSGALNLNEALPLSASLPAGAYRIYAFIDSAGKIAETDESNNVAESAVVQIAQPNYDLIPSFDPKTKLLPSILTGVKTSGTVRVVIANSSGGSAALPAGQKVQVQIVARPIGAMDESQDIVINKSVFVVSLGSLAAGKSKTFSIALIFPPGLAAETYNIVAKVDTGNALAETDETNNEVTFANTLVVAAPFSDPTLAFDAGTIIPPGVVADGRKLPLKFDVENLGNTKIPAGQTCSIAIFAHNISTNTDTPLETFTVKLTGLASGGLKTLTLSPAIPVNLGTGEFEIRAALATTVSGDVVGNNTASCATTLNVGPAFYNLSLLPPTTTFNPAVLLGTTTSGTVSVGIRNLSNSQILPGATATVQVVLRPVGAVDDSNDIPIGTASNVSLAGLTIGASKTVKVSCKIPTTFNSNPIVAGNYELVATMSATPLIESTLSDNTIIGSTINIAPSFIDLAVISATQSFRTPSANGSGGTGTVVVRNTGNVPVQGNINIQFFATPEESAVSSRMGQQTFFVSLAPGASSPPLNVALLLTIPADGLLATAVDVVARIDPASLADSNLSNNQLAAGTVVVSSQYVDLTIASVTNPFSGTLNGNQTGSGHVLLANIGSGLSAGPVTVNYYASLTSTLDGSQILLGSQVANVSLGSAQLSPTIDVALALPNPDSETTYKILAQITSSPTIDNNSANNLTTVLGTVTVEPVGP